MATKTEDAAPADSARGYPDLHEHIAALREAGHGIGELPVVSVRIRA